MDTTTTSEVDDLITHLHAVMSETEDGAAYTDPRAVAIIEAVTWVLAQAESGEPLEGSDPCVCGRPYSRHPGCTGHPVYAYDPDPAIRHQYIARWPEAAR